MKRKSQKVKALRRKIFISLICIVPLGFLTKFYQGPGALWFNNYAGGMLYEVFWCLAAAFVLPSASAFRIALTVFCVTCALEFLQLVHPAFLETIRSVFIGRTLIGTSFTWMDFPYYAVGCLIGWVWIHRLRKAD